MFERRVRIVLGLLVLVALALLVRAAQVQVAQAGHWQYVAGQSLRRSVLTETSRGRILDVKGRELAVDAPCIDAAVAYWFITEKPDEERLYSDVARKLARRTPDYAQLSRDEQHELVLSYMPAARVQLEAMWDELARLGGVTRAEIDASRREIVDRVTRRRRQVVLNRYRDSLDEHAEQGLSPWWRRWLLGDADAPPEMADFEEKIAEELQAHVVVPNISIDAYNELRKRIDELPGLSLKASQTRSYPGGNAAAHVVGFLAPVIQEELAADPEITNELRSLLPRDLIGRSGIEALAEPQLRGTRGRIDHDLETGKESVAHEKVAGKDVQTTIDLELQIELRKALQNVTFLWPDEDDSLGKVPDKGPAPGAIVVIDVPTGAIMGMVSGPDFDPNTYGEDYARLSLDYIDRPLLNRATGFATVTGSIIKPIIGLAAVTEGLHHAHGTVPCDGYMYIDGKPLGNLRCWTASMFGTSLQGHSDFRDPHPTAGLNLGLEPAPGHLTLADAIQRSCNIFFQVLALKLGEPRITKWMTAFGLGQPTGVGLPEQRGLTLADLPDDIGAHAMQGKVLLSATGQGHVQATPLQMANVAATLARRGKFIRPTLTVEDTKLALAEARDLKIDPQAMEMVHRGMVAAAQTLAGTGSAINSQLPLPIAGKTGSAQAHPLSIPQRGPDGKYLRDEDGQLIREALPLSTRDAANPRAPWYRRANLTSTGEDPRQAHAWYIGYAPADNPKVAFVVFIEYGGSGGASAGSVVPQIIDALVRLGYLTPTRPLKPGAEGENPQYVVENPF